ncbi:hypothetical protein HDZ31DRAFT_83733 [Schizophyllum fasciatum]
MEDEHVLDWSVEDDEQRQQYSQFPAQAPAAGVDEETISLGGDDDDDDAAYYPAETADRTHQDALRSAGSPPARSSKRALNPPSRSLTPVGRAGGSPSSPRASDTHLHSSPPPDDGSPALQPRITHALPAKPVASMPFKSRAASQSAQAATDAVPRPFNRREKRTTGNGFAPSRSQDVPEVVPYSGPPLPSGWEARQSRSNNRIYFYNEITQISTWTHPELAVRDALLNLDFGGVALFPLLRQPRPPSRLARAPAMGVLEGAIGCQMCLLHIARLHAAQRWPGRLYTHARRTPPPWAPAPATFRSPSLYRSALSGPSSVSACTFRLLIICIPDRPMDMPAPMEIDPPAPQPVRKRDRPSRFDRAGPLPPLGNMPRSRSVEDSGRQPPVRPPTMDPPVSMYPNRNVRAEPASPPRAGSVSPLAESRPPPRKRAPLPPQSAHFSKQALRPRSPPPPAAVHVVSEPTQAPISEQRRPIRPLLGRDFTDRDVEQSMDVDEPMPARAGGMYADREIGPVERDFGQRDRQFMPRARDMPPRGGSNDERGRERGRGGPPPISNDLPRGPRAMAHGEPDRAPSPPPLARPPMSSGPSDFDVGRRGGASGAGPSRGGYTDRRASSPPMGMLDDAPPPPIARGDRGGRFQDFGRRGGRSGGRGRGMPNTATGTNSTPVSAPRPFGAPPVSAREASHEPFRPTPGKEVYERTPEFVPRQPEPLATNRQPYSEPMPPMDRRAHDNGWVPRGQSPMRMGTRSVTPPSDSRNNQSSNFKLSPPLDRRADNRGPGRFPGGRGQGRFPGPDDRPPYAANRGPYPQPSDHHRPFNAPDERPPRNVAPFADQGPRRFDDGPEDAPRFEDRGFADGNGRGRGGRGRGRREWQNDGPAPQPRNFDERRGDYARGPPPPDLYRPRDQSPPRGPHPPFYPSPGDGRLGGPAYDDRAPEFINDGPPPMRGNGPPMRVGPPPLLRHAPPPHMRTNGPPLHDDGPPMRNSAPPVNSNVGPPMHAGPPPRDSPPMMRNGERPPTLLSRLSNVGDAAPFVPTKRAREDEGEMGGGGSGGAGLERSPKSMRGEGGEGARGGHGQFDDGLDGRKRRRGRSARRGRGRGSGGGGSGPAMGS